MWSLKKERNYSDIDDKTIFKELDDHPSKNSYSSTQITFFNMIKQRVPKHNQWRLPLIGLEDQDT